MNNERKEDAVRANFTGVTVSNGGRIRLGKAAEVQAIIDRYCCLSKYINISICNNVLSISGYDWLYLYYVDAEGDLMLGEEADAVLEDFLTEIGPYLVEDFRVQMIGSDDGRYPLSACEYTVTPIGRITKRGF